MEQKGPSAFEIQNQMNMHQSAGAEAGGHEYNPGKVFEEFIKAPHVDNPVKNEMMSHLDTLVKASALDLKTQLDTAGAAAFGKNLEGAGIVPGDVSYMGKLESGLEAAAMHTGGVGVVSAGGGQGH